MDTAVIAVAALTSRTASNPLQSRRTDRGTSGADLHSARAFTVRGSRSHSPMRLVDTLGLDGLTSSQFRMRTVVRRAATGSPVRLRVRVAAVDVLIHTGDDPGADISQGRLTSPSSAAFGCGRGAAARPISSPSTRPIERGRGRGSSSAPCTRRGAGRAAQSTLHEGHTRHGPRGAPEFAETVDRLSVRGDNRASPVGPDRGASSRPIRRRDGSRLHHLSESGAARSIANASVGTAGVIFGTRCATPSTTTSRHLSPRRERRGSRGDPSSVRRPPVLRHRCRRPTGCCASLFDGAAGRRRQLVGG